MAKKVIKEEKAPKRRANRRIAAQAAPWLFVENFNHLVVNDDYVRVLCVNGYKDSEPLGWGEGLIGLGGTDSMVTLVMVRRSGDDLKAMINRTRNETEVWSVDKINETYAERRRKEHESEQAELVTDMIIKADAKIFETYAYIVLRAPSKELLDEKTRTVKNMLSSRMMSAFEFTAAQRDMFYAASPLMSPDEFMEQVNNHFMPSTTIAQAQLNSERGICHPQGIDLGDDFQGGLCRINPTAFTDECPNGNIFLTAESGSGKSALIKHIVTYLRTLLRCRIYINDVDGEFSKLTRALGGKVVHLDSSSAMLLSPFIPRNVGSDAEGRDDDGTAQVTDAEIAEARERALDNKVLSTHLPFLVTFLVKAFSIDPNDGKAKSLLYLACERAYNRIGVTGAVTFREYNRSDRKHPCLEDVYKELGSIKGEMPEHASVVSELELVLMRGVSGSDRHLWQRSSERIPDDCMVVCINLQGLSADPAMMAAQYYNVTTWEWTQLVSDRYTGTFTFVVNDEVQKMVNAKNAEAALALKDMVQRVRKYGAAMICATQMISDMLGGDDPDGGGAVRAAGQGLVYNSAYQLFGKTSGDPDKAGTNTREVKTLLNATDDVMLELADADRRKFVLRAGSKQQSWLQVKELPQWELDLFGRGGGM